jgi:hypothetical protein
MESITLKIDFIFLQKKLKIFYFYAKIFLMSPLAE